MLSGLGQYYTSEFDTTKQEVVKEKNTKKQTLEKDAYNVIIVIFSATGTIVLCLNILVTSIIYKETTQNHALLEQPMEQLSVLCCSLSMHPDDDVFTFDTITSGLKISVNSDSKYVCRTKNVTQTVDLVVEKHHRVLLAGGLRAKQYHFSCGNKSLAPTSGDSSAYFSKIARSFHHSGNVSQDKVRWDTSELHSHGDPEILYNDGEITISEANIYFVYASVMFRLNQTAYETTNKTYTLSVAVCKKTNGYEHLLIGKTEIYRNIKGYFATSLNVASYFQLQQGDILLVRVSDSRLVHYDSKGNIFGLFKA